jgi:hypothetical protein
MRVDLKYCLTETMLACVIAFVNWRHATRNIFVSDGGGSPTVSAGEHTAIVLCIILTTIQSSYSSFQKAHIMKLRTASLSLALMMSLASVSNVSKAGCLAGAAVGGVAGHVAGHHSLLGAAAGCAVGHHMSKKKARQQAAADARAQQAQQPQQPQPVRR